MGPGFEKKYDKNRFTMLEQQLQEMKRLVAIVVAACFVAACGSNQGNGQKDITVNLRYTGSNGSARAFAEEMISSGTVEAIRAEEGNLRYEYFQSLDDPETILLIDSWTSQDAIDAHHASPMMATIAALREKYDLHMTVERYSKVNTPRDESRFIRK